MSKCQLPGCEKKKRFAYAYCDDCRRNVSIACRTERIVTAMVHGVGNIPTPHELAEITEKARRIAIRIQDMGLPEVH